MKQFTNIIRFTILLTSIFIWGACDDYLGDIPKGQKTPKSFIDYNAFINYSDQMQMEIDHICCLMNESFKSNNSLNSDPLLRTHYYWDESEDRKLINSTDRAYDRAYSGIFYWNLIVEYGGEATECTQAQRDMLVAQARVLRSITYFYVANYFADQYCDATLDKLCVPLVTSTSLEAPSPQVTIKEMYDFLIEDLKLAIPHLPEVAENMYHPTKASGYGILARVYLSMGNYDKALENAEAALKLNNKLFNWIDYYNADKVRFETPDDYKTQLAPGYNNLEQTNVENYLFKHSSMMFYNGNSNTAYSLSVERAEQFEKGDTRLLTHWKARNTAALGDYYAGIYAVEPNKGGIRSAEMYYIKAECLARKGGAENIKSAMDVVNTVRKTRILPEYYSDLAASTTQEAVEKIMVDKGNEFIQDMVSFCDRRRLNKDPLYAKTLTKTVNGVTYELKPDSHLWIMPFPQKVIDNPGNGIITQNTPK